MTEGRDRQEQGNGEESGNGEEREHPREDAAALIRGADVAPPPVPVKVEGSQRRRLNVTVLLVLSAGAAFLLVRMLWPFVPGIIGALVLAVLAYPAHRKVEGLIPHPSTAAFVSTSLLIILVVVPLSALSVALFNSLQDHADVVANQVTAFLEPGGRGRQWVDEATAWLGSQGEGVVDAIRSQFRSLGSFLAGSTVGILSGLGGGLVQAGVGLFTLYYLLLDGPRLMKEVESLIPLDDDLTSTLVHRSRDIIRATMFGNVVVGIAQGALSGVTFWLLGIPGAVLWGTVIAILGMIPVLGPPVVWVPAAVILFLQGEVARSIILFAVGALMVGTVDNVLRATVVSGRAQLHPLVVFFSALGGIILFGMMGIFLGPVLFVISMSILEVTRAALDQENDGDAGSDPAPTTPPG